MKRDREDRKDCDSKIVFKVSHDDKVALAKYYPSFLNTEEANELYQELYNLKDKYFDRDLVNTPKGKVLAPRYTAAFGEEGISYKYAGMNRSTITEWPELLLKCKESIETTLDVKLNYGFVNIYEIVDNNGNKVDQYIGWHSDSEGDIVTTSDGQTTICSISLGDERKFQLRENYKVGKEKPTPITSIVLEHGSLCTMEKHTQQLCVHCVPKKPNASKPRINITFRLMKVSDTNHKKIKKCDTNT